MIAFKGYPCMMPATEHVCPCLTIHHAGEAQPHRFLTLPVLSSFSDT